RRKRQRQPDLRPQGDISEPGGEHDPARMQLSRPRLDPERVSIHGKAFHPGVRPVATATRLQGPVEGTQQPERIHMAVVRAEGRPGDFLADPRQDPAQLLALENLDGDPRAIGSTALANSPALLELILAHAEMKPATAPPAGLQ